MRILYVEDDPVDADLTREDLARHDSRSVVDVVGTLADARSRLAADPAYDLVLSDVTLPDGSGLELLSEIRERRLPLAVVMLTGSGDVDTVVAALRAGADDYQVKGAEGARLSLTLTAALARFRARAAGRPGSLRVMYAEPDPLAADAIRRHLERHAPHLRLDVVASPEELRRLLRPSADEPAPGDVLLLECRRESDASLDVLKALLDERRLPTPVVMLGQEGDEQIAAHALRLGADVHYLVKHPNYLHALPATLESAHRGALLAREQAALRESQGRLVGLIETAMDAIISMDAEHRVVLFNPAAERMFRCPAEEALGQPIERFMPERFRAGHRARVEAFARTGTTNRAGGHLPAIVGRRSDGEEFPIEASISKTRVAGQDLYTVILRDVTERSRDVERLRASEERFRQLAENIHEVFWMTDVAKSQILFVSPGYERVWGRSCESVYANPRAWMESIHPEDRERVREAALTRQVPGTYDEEYRILRSDGAVRWIHDRAFPVYDASGQAYRVVGVAEDVTERRRTEEALRASTERFRRYFDLGLIGMAITSPDAGFLEVNDYLCQLLGYERNELVGMRWPELTHPDDLAGDVRQFDRVLAGELDGYSLEKRFIRKDGQVVRATIAVRAVRRPHGPVDYFVALLQDVTERRNAEEQQRSLEDQLRQAQKMEAVGRLAGGVAHDFNNMLNVILGHADLALRKSSPVDPIRRNLEQIRSAARRSADLTRQLLAFSRRQTIAPRVLDLNARMKGMESLLRRIIGEDVDLEFRLGEGLWPVSMDPSQVDQVVANLAVNARDAMPDGGRLTVETSNVTLDAAFCRMDADARPGEFLLLAVSDTGCGMDAQTIERAFEPFFTTKPEGKGTGLGLATVYGIARQNGGSVRIHSEVGGGTTVRLYLPRHLGGEAPRPVAAPPAAPERGSETILLVEDEAQLRELAREILEDLGYHVIVAATPGEAISLCEKHPGRIDLLLTDVVMPVMNGRELSERVRALKPEIKVLFTSGYTADAIAHHGVLEPGVEFLEKPFSLSAVAEKVRAALAGGAGP